MQASENLTNCNIVLVFAGVLRDGGLGGKRLEQRQADCVIPVDNLNTPPSEYLSRPYGTFLDPDLLRHTGKLRVLRRSGSSKISTPSQLTD